MLYLVGLFKVQNLFFFSVLLPQFIFDIFVAEKTTPKAPETPTQVTRSGRAVKANRRFIDDMETGSSDEEEVRVDHRATFCCIR